MCKYELTNETTTYAGRTLHRIRALRDFGNVKAGELGGWIEREANLSQDGDAWVYDNTMVYGDAWVSSAEAILSISNIGSRNDTTTFFACKDGKIGVTCGCFRGDIDKFERAVKQTHGDNKYARQFTRTILTGTCGW